MDQDGPLSGFDQAFFELCDVKGWPVDCTLETQTARYATDHLPRALRDTARQYIYRAGWFRDLPVVKGAIDGINDLAKHADVWICTKPLEQNWACRDDKAAWVRRHLGEDWERRLIVTPDKSLIVGDILLDDAPNPNWYAAATWWPVIYPAPWNGEGTQWSGLPRWQWGDPIETLLGRVDFEL